MSRTSIILFLLLSIGCTAVATSQLKSQPDDTPRISDSMIRTGGSDSFLGFFDPSRFSMRHSYSFSTMLMGGRSMGIGMYTNSMFYKVSDPLNVRVDVSFVHSPFNSLGSQFQQNLNKLFLNRAEVNYRPSENMLIQLQFRQVPYSLYGGYSSPYYYNPFYQGF
jgi:hypothetical protein